LRIGEKEEIEEVLEPGARPFYPHHVSDPVVGVGIVSVLRE